MEWKIKDEKLGLITLRANPRARRYTLKISNGQIVGVMPSGGDLDRMIAFIEEKRPQLKKALMKHPAKPILNETTDIRTSTFKLHIFRTERSNYYMKLDQGILHISCPQNTDFTKETVQKTLYDLLGKALVHEANRVLPKRLQELAIQHRFIYTGVRISRSKGNWGSCNQKKAINLSRSLMLLPGHLIDYVLLHELCHTREMSHNTRFWDLMDRVTENKAKELRAELKNYHTI